MKKLFSILALAMIIGLFSSCIIVATSEPEPEPPTYTFYFFNDTNDDIRDWYLIDRKGKIYSKQNDGYACPIDEGEISSKKGLRQKDYLIFYEYEHGTKNKTSYFTLDSDTTFRLSNRSITSGKPRSAGN